MRIEDVLKGHGLGIGNRLGDEALALINQSPVYNGVITSIVRLGDYLYIGGSATTTVLWKIDIKTMSKVGELSFPSAIYSITTDGIFLYVGIGTVWKVDPNTMRKISESANGDYQYITYHNGYIYTSTIGYKLSKLNSSDLSLVATSPANAITTYANAKFLTPFNGSIYCSFFDSIAKLNTNTMTWDKTFTVNANYAIVAITTDDTYLYVNVYYSLGYIEVKKIDPITLDVVGSLTLTPSSWYGLVFAEKHLYAGKGTDILSVNVQTLTIEKTHGNFMTEANIMIYDGECFYCADASKKVSRLANLYFKK